MCVYTVSTKQDTAMSLIQGQGLYVTLQDYVHITRILWSGPEHFAFAFVLRLMIFEFLGVSYISLSLTHVGSM